MAKLELSMPYVFENEGGYTVDSGGPTNWGITIPDVAKYRGVPSSSITAGDMRRLSKLEATEIYRKEYWSKMKLDGVFSQNVATAIFDIGVNRGISVGAKYAQKTANLLENSLVIDGKIGPKTLQAINFCNDHLFIMKLEALDFAGYEAILASRPDYEIYRKGWESRARRLLTLV